jgi:hypothetical protein
MDVLKSIRYALSDIDEKISYGPQRFWEQMQHIQKTLNTIAHLLGWILGIAAIALIRHW